MAEDTDSNFQVLSAILRNDYELLRARDGDEAVRLVEQYRFVAVLMDMKMPVMDGLEATRKIKGRESDAAGDRGDRLCLRS